MSFKAPESLAEQIAQHIGKKIIKGELDSRERIQELKVANELEVSRGSVREALLILEGRHLIDILPRRGAMVSELTRDRVTALYEFYITLLTMLIHKLADDWKEGDEHSIRESLNNIRQQASSGRENLELVVDGGFDLMRICFPIVKNVYLEETLEKLQPASASYLLLHNAKKAGRVG